MSYRPITLVLGLVIAAACAVNPVTGKRELQAVCFQHEIDHLDGILFIDRISRLKRNLYTQRRKKQLRRELEEQSGS